MVNASATKNSESGNFKDLSGKYKTNTYTKYFSTSNRICVECIKKNKYIKKYWDIFLVFEKWPKEYNNLLEFLQDKNKSVGKVGISRFGQYYQVLYGKETKHNNQNLNILREGFKEYLISNWMDGNIKLLKNMDIKEDEIKYVSLNQAAGILKKSDATIKMLLENEVLEGIIKNNNIVNFYLVSIESIEEYKKIEESPKIKVRKSYNELGNFITKIDLERFLCIGEHFIKEMVCERLLNPVSGPEIDNNHTRIYRTKELRYLFNNFNSKVKRNLGFDDSNLVSFHDARKLINCSFTELIRYVLNFEITIIKKSEDIDESLKHYYFVKDL